MVGEDAVSVYTQLLMKFMDLLVKIGEEKHRNKQPKKPKIRQGKLSKHDFNSLIRKGAEFGFIQVPKNIDAEVERITKEMGGTFFKVDDTDNNNVLYAVPMSQTDFLYKAQSQVSSKAAIEEPSSISIKDGDNRIEAEDMPLVSDIMTGYDIPMISFKNKDGKYTNIVPAEFEGQYQSAMNTAMDIKSRMEDIEVMTFEQTSSLDAPDHIAKILDNESAQELFRAVSSHGLDVRFTPYRDGTAVVYPKWQAPKVDKADEEYHKAIDESRKYQITVNDNSISIDKGTLLKAEDEVEYFVRVPNTHSQDHLKLTRDDVREINEGKTLTTRLDPDKMYPVFDPGGQFVSERQGSELLKLYDVKHKGINKDTQVAEYGNRADKIELFNKEQNKLISIGIDSADTIRAELMEQGITSQTADTLLREINEILNSDEYFTAYRSIFNYTVEVPQIKYADIPNIGDYLAQTQLSENIIGKAECVGYLPQTNGPRCCIYDRAENKYSVIHNTGREDIVLRLNEMGYNAMLAKQLADRAVKGADPQDVEEPVQHFNSTNAELENLSYTIGKDRSVLIYDSGDAVKYMCIDKGCSMKDIESALYSGFGLQDKASAAAVMKELSEKSMIEALPKRTIGDFEITRVTSDMIEVNNNASITKEPVIMPIDKPDHKLLRNMGADERTIRSIEHSLKKSAEEFGKPDTLTNLKKFAENAAHTIGQTAEKVGKSIESAAAKISEMKSDER